MRHAYWECSIPRWTAGLRPGTAKALVWNGFESPAQVRQGMREALLSDGDCLIAHIGKRRAREILAWLELA